MSEPSGQRSATVVRKDIADFVVEHANELPDVPGVKEFAEQHGRHTKEIAATTKRGNRLAKAMEKYEPFEGQVRDCQDAFKGAEAELAKLYRPLGQAAFQAFLDGDIKRGRILADRLAVHDRLETLQQERADLTPDHDVGITQIAKAKAHQLAITGKIKLEEAKFGKLEDEIGRQLILENQDDSVRCDSTLKLLDEITFCRENIIKCKQEVRSAENARENAVNQLCEAIPLQHIENSQTFDVEVKSCKKTIRESESALAKATRSVIDAFAEIDSSKLPEPLTTMLLELQTAKNDDAAELFKEAGEEFQEATNELRRSFTGFTGTTKRWWSGLSTKGKTITVVVSVALMVALGSLPPSNKSSNAAHTVDGTLTAAVGKFPSSHFSKGPNGEEVKVGGDGLDSDWYFHYYLDGDGNKVSHGRSQIGTNIPGYGQRGIMNSLTDNGEVVVRATSYLDGKLFAVLTRVKDETYQKDEYPALSVGGTLHVRSLWKITKTDGGESHEIIDAPYRVKDTPPLSRSNGWPIESDFLYLNLDDIEDLLGPPDSTYRHPDPSKGRLAYVWQQPDGDFTVIVGVDTKDLQWASPSRGFILQLVRVNMSRSIATVIIKDQTRNIWRD